MGHYSQHTGKAGSLNNGIAVTTIIERMGDAGLEEGYGRSLCTPSRSSTDTKS